MSNLSQNQKFIVLTFNKKFNSSMKLAQARQIFKMFTFNNQLACKLSLLHPVIREVVEVLNLKKLKKKGIGAILRISQNFG